MTARWAFAKTIMNELLLFALFCGMFGTGVWLAVYYPERTEILEWVKDLTFPVFTALAVVLKMDLGQIVTRLNGMRGGGKNEENESSLSLGLGP